MPVFEIPLGDQQIWQCLDEFEQAYCEAMFWTECNDNNPELKIATFADMSREAYDRIIADCAKFRDDAKIVVCIGNNTAQAGHDFWLTRNGHGAGFWDGDWPEPDASCLDDRCGIFGEIDLYMGDDGKLYF